MMDLRGSSGAEDVSERSKEAREARGELLIALQVGVDDRVLEHEQV